MSHKKDAMRIWVKPTYFLVLNMEFRRYVIFLICLNYNILNAKRTFILIIKISRFNETRELA